ncbi:MAG: ZIP family metal transporter [Chloroflexota bacterium]
METVSVWTVLIASSITAIATGLGALPFLFVKDINKRWLGIGNALAAGLMLGASLGLIYESTQLDNVDDPIIKLLIGLVLGLVLVVVAQNALSDQDEDFHIGNVDGADAVSMLLIVGVMTVHSFAEGIGVGVSWGDGTAFGSLISVAIAIHNIPEGLAISLVLIPRGTSVWKAAGWSIFSSIPQPLMAVPAYLFVLVFRPFLPIGLGLAAGAMIWMVFRELLPEALEDMPRSTVYPVIAIAVIGMLLFQFLIG